MAGRRDIGSNAISIDDLQQVAQVLKSNGIDGELVMGFRGITPEDINIEEPVFIVFDGLPVPFFIESFVRRGNTKALVRLTDISSQEDVEEIVGKAVYVTEESMEGLTLEDDGFAALVGWRLLTVATELPVSQENAGPAEIEEDDIVEVGEIIDFIDIPNNPCIEVETEKGVQMGTPSYQMHSNMP